MAGFRYQAVDASGRIRKGVLESDSARQVRIALREQGLTALEVDSLATKADTPGGSGATVFRRGLSTAQLSLLTRQFATMLGASLTVEQAMNALIEQAENQHVRQLLGGVRGEVLAGHPLARAMSQHPAAFPELYRTLVQAGEQSGQLSEVMVRLAEYTEDRQKLRNKVMLAFIYPAIITVVAIGVITAMLAFVVPQVVQVFQSSHQTLPLLTRAMIATSGFVRTTGIYWLIALAVGIVALLRALRQPALRMRFDSFVLRLPVLGRLVRSLNTARLASTLAILVNSRVPLIGALQAAVGVVANLPMKQALVDTERRVREGASLSRSLAATRMFPPLMVHLIASGEASGTLDRMLERVAINQAEEIENRVATLTSLLEPLLILTMGGIVLTIVLAVLLPIFELNQMVK